MNIRRPRPATRPRLEVLEGRQLLATFTVSSFGDAGPGTLRQAILDADSASASGPGRIVFKLPPPPVAFGVYPVVEIDPAAELPAISSGVVVDATTQSGYVAASGPVVVINGSGNSHPQFSALPGEGLVVAGDNAGVIGLSVKGFAGDQILLAGRQDFAQGNRLGGGVKLGPRFIGASRGGISLLGSGGDSIQGNILSSNSFGIFLGPGASRNVLEGNFSEFNDYGLYSVDSTNNGIGSTTGNDTGNQFTNDDIAGVVLIDRAPPSMVKPQGNLIAGNVISGNGVLVLNGDVANFAAITLISSGGNTIGGTAAAASNHIIDNYGDGLLIGTNPTIAPGQAVASGNLVQGNLIGGSPSIVDPHGPVQAPLIGNIGNAVVLGAGSSGTTVVSNTLAYNGGAPIVDGGRGDVTTGNLMGQDEQRLVDFGVAVRVTPSTGPYAVGSTVTVDFTVFNAGGGYADQAFLDLNFTSSPGLTLASFSGAGLLASQPSPTRYEFSLGNSSGHPAGSPGVGWLPHDQATLRVNFIATKAGLASIQAIVGSSSKFDNNPNDKVYGLPLTFH